MSFEFAKKGSIVFYAGDIPDRFYILLKGNNKVFPLVIL
jgi:CRP-like cAMP-binding protein